MNGNQAMKMQEEDSAADGFVALVNHDIITGPQGYLQVCHGIAAQIEAKGAQSLSARQKDVVGLAVSKFEDSIMCECGHEVELGEWDAFLSSGSGLCSYHEYQRAKDD